MLTNLSLPRLSAEEAAAMIFDNATVGFSGFTAAGSAKAVPRALAERGRRLHAAGEKLRIRVLSGASTGPCLDDLLGDADMVAWRAPYQSSRAMRQRINRQETEFVDMHLSHVPQMVEFGFFGNLDFAVVEVTEVTRDGRVYLSSSIGASPSYLHHADKIIIELNQHHSKRLWEMHDVVILPPAPGRHPIAISHPMSKIGVPFVTVDTDKIVGIVETDEADGIGEFSAADEVSDRIAEHVTEFLLREMRAPGRIPPEFLPLQAGVGNVANAVMSALGAHPDIPPFYMYSEVLQDSLVGLLENGQLLGVSACSLTVSDRQKAHIYDNMDFFARRVVLRPQELSNNPEVIRRLGVVAINTVLESDIYGCANSTHVCGTRLMNGIGGSGDFVRNGALSILVSPSTAKDGRISSIVPMCSHVDHTEHSVQIIATEHGLADIRGMGPTERARTIIETCAHPAYRPYLMNYLETAPMGHFRHDLTRCFEMHRNLLEHGAMLPGLDI